MARSGRTTRKLEVFDLHLRDGDTEVDYLEVFSALRRISRRQRIQDRGDRVVALPVVEVRRSTAFLVAYEGAIGVKPLLFDLLRGTQRVENLAQSEVVVTRTHALVDVKARQAIVEYNQRGAKASDIAEAIEDIVRRHTGWSSMVVELNPVADVKFDEAIRAFRRIRLASVKLVRPNSTWEEHANTLTALATESQARTIEVGASAEVAQSLPKQAGIVRLILDLLRERRSQVRGAHVTGQRDQDAEETTVSLAHYTEHRRVPVSIAPDGQVDSGAIRKELERLRRDRA